MPLTKWCYCALIVTANLLLGGCETLMPSADKPYRLALGDSGAIAASPWRWVDARSQVLPDNRGAEAAWVFGDAVFSPRPYQQIQQEFLRAINAHSEAAKLTQRLRGKTIRLQEFEATVGLWARLSGQQNNRWEFVRVTVALQADGQDYSAQDVHKFNNSDQPSPVSIPLRNAVDNIVNQMAIFGRD